MVSSKQSPVKFPSEDTPGPLGTFDGSSTIVFDRLSNDNPYMSYSGADIVATITMPGGETIILGELQTLSYSIHRENTPVRLLGHAAPVSFVKGTRTIAGSLIFTVFNKYAFYKINCMADSVYNGYYPLADQLPPFDITINLVNEYGSFSKMKIMGISIIDEGGTMSIDDLITEQTFTYVARGIQPMISYKPAVATEKTGIAAKESINPKSAGRTSFQLL